MKVTSNTPKTSQHDGDVYEFLDAVENPHRREDARRVLELMREVTGEPPKMWGPSIVGFGSYHYKYASGREGEWMITGFSPRKQNLTVYIIPGFSEFAGLLAKLGKHKSSKSCLYLNKLADVDLDVLAELVRESVKIMEARYKQAN